MKRSREPGNFTSKILITIIGLICCISGSLAADFTIRDDSFEQFFGEMELRGLFAPAGLRMPLTFEQYLRTPDSAQASRLSEYQGLRLPFAAGNQVRLFGDFEGWGAKSDSEQAAIGHMRTGLLIGSGRWSLVGTYDGVSGNDFTDRYYGYRWRGVKAKTDQLYLRWSGDKSFFQVGKDYIRYGMGLAISGHDPYENIQAGVSLGDHFKLHCFLGKLDGWVSQETFVNRFLAGHRAEISFGAVQMGISEFVIYGGPGRTAEMYYMLPLYIYLGEQDNRQIDDNVIWDADLKIVKPPFRLTGEIMIDDFQIESKTAGDREPIEAGLGLQADWAIASQPCYITTSLCYRMITNWTFNQNKDWNRFLFESHPIGAEEGNDFDRLSWKLSATAPFGLGTGEVYYRRKGQGMIEDPWTCPWETDSTWHQTFPTGVVERTVGFQLGLDWHPDALKLFGSNRPINIFGLWRYQRSENYSNISGQRKDQWLIKLGIGYSISGKIIDLDQ